jgi:hypothetical protein
VQILDWLSQTAPSIWIREGTSIWAYPMIITLHSVGLAVMVGLSVVVALRILGVASALPLAAMERLYPAIWAGFVINTISGIGLILGDPVGMLTNPLFGVKILLVAAAVANVAIIERRVVRSPRAHASGASRGGQMLATASLVLWVAATTMGRLTAYLEAQ